MKPTGCVRCGAAGSHVLHPLELVACEKCNHDWLSDPTLQHDVVSAAVGGWDHVRSERYSTYCERFDAELLKRTESWAKKARAA